MVTEDINPKWLLVETGTMLKVCKTHHTGGLLASKLAVGAAFAQQWSSQRGSYSGPKLMLLFQGKFRKQTPRRAWNLQHCDKQQQQRVVGSFVSKETSGCLWFTLVTDQLKLRAVKVVPTLQASQQRMCSTFNMVVQSGPLSHTCVGLCQQWVHGRTNIFEVLAQETLTQENRARSLCICLIAKENSIRKMPSSSIFKPGCPRRLKKHCW